MLYSSVMETDMSSRLAALYSALDGDLIRETGFGVDFYRSLPSIPSDFTHAQAAAYSAVTSLGKKFLPDNCEVQDARALAKFVACNERASKWVYNPCTSLDEVLFGTFQQVLYKFFTPGGYPLADELDSCFLKGKVGPGSAIGGSGEDFYSKMFSSVLSYSSPILLEHYKRNVVRFPEWIAAEDFRSASLGEAAFVKGSRLSFVPKTTAISRSICVEPSLNMFYQLGLGEILSSRLRSFFKIDLSLQPELNRKLARLGSIDGSLATIDLESASDSISVELCRRALPKELFSLLMDLRSPSCNYRGQTYTFEMISTMGNGFTFPLQTIIFASAVSAVYKVFDRVPSFGPDALLGVFGDDIIVHSDMYERVVSFLHALGFTVNLSKSFSQGRFRESCGCDYYSGRNIRGVYAVRLNSHTDSYSLINRFNWFSARTGLHLPDTIRQLSGWCDMSIVVPASEDFSSGVQVPLEMVSKRRLSRQTQAISYVCYVAKKRTIRIGEVAVIVPRGMKRRIYNPSGLLVSFLSGMALSSGLPTRESKVRWTKKRRYCSWWDSLPPDSVSNDGVSWLRWKTATSENLLGY